MLAQCFIPNPDNKTTVDHINRVRDDNRLENLRWATHAEQMENRNLAVTKPRKTNKLGETYIHKRKWDTYRLKITRHGVSKTYKTLAEAKYWRDYYTLFD